VGGQFNVAGQDYANIARFNPTNGLLDTSFNPIMGRPGGAALGWQLNDQIVAVVSSRMSTAGLLTTLRGLIQTARWTAPTFHRHRCQ